MAILLYPMIVWFGLMGAVVTSMISWTLNHALMVWRSAHLLNIRIKEFVPWAPCLRVLTLSIVSGVGAELARRMPGVSVIGRLIFATIVFVVLYGVLLFHSGIVPQRYKEQIAFRVRRIVNAVFATG